MGAAASDEECVIIIHRGRRKLLRGKKKKLGALKSGGDYVPEVRKGRPREKQSTEK